VEFLKEGFANIIMIKLSVDSLQDIEVFLLAGKLVPLQQLVQHILGVDKVLAILLPMLLVV
jgi:metal-responsive CopG/Arc/MetJ family transcriptional regulator